MDGQGNFGSIFGLPAAAERYTEARLTALSDQIMQERYCKEVSQWLERAALVVGLNLG